MTDTYLERIAAGDAGAVDACIDRYGGLVWSLARRMTASPADAEDAVQEIFISLWQNAARFDPNAAGEKTFVAMVARRRLIDRLRRAQARPEFALPEDYDAAADTVSPEDSVDAALAGRVMAEMKPEQRKVLKLALHLGLSHGEIARVNDMAIGTVKSHIRRGLAFMRERLMETSKPGRLTP